jgi:hypothetical protein
MAEQYNHSVRVWTPAASKTDGLIYMDTARPLPFTLPLTTAQTAAEVLESQHMHPFWPMPEQRMLPNQKPYNITEMPMHVASLNDSELTAMDVLTSRLTKEGIEQELVLNWQLKIRNWHAELPFLTDVGATSIYDAFHRFGQVRVTRNGIYVELGSQKKNAFSMRLSNDRSRIESNHPMYGGGKVDKKYAFPYVHKRSAYGRNVFSMIAGMLPGEDNIVLSYNLEYDKRLMQDPGFLTDVVGMPYDRPEFIRPYIHPFIQIQRFKTQ